MNIGKALASRQYEIWPRFQHYGIFVLKEDFRKHYGQARDKYHMFRILKLEQDSLVHIFDKFFIFTATSEESAKELNNALVKVPQKFFRESEGEDFNLSDEDPMIEISIPICYFTSSSIIVNRLDNMSKKINQELYEQNFPKYRGESFIPSVHIVYIEDISYDTPDFTTYRIMFNSKEAARLAEASPFLIGGFPEIYFGNRDGEIGEHTRHIYADFTVPNGQPTLAIIISMIRASLPKEVGRIHVTARNHATEKRNVISIKAASEDALDYVIKLILTNAIDAGVNIMDSPNNLCHKCLKESTEDHESCSRTEIQTQSFASNSNEQAEAGNPSANIKLTETHKGSQNPTSKVTIQ